MVKKKDKGGRPKTSKAQLIKWLDELRPFLVAGSSMWTALGASGLMKHKGVIYKNYNLGGWFREEIDGLQALVGQYTNEAFVALVKKIRDKAKAGDSITRDEIQILRIVAEKHRTSQPFFVSRTETAEAKDDDFGRIVERPTIVVNAPKKKKKKKKEDAKPKDVPAEDSVQPNAETVEGVEGTEGPDNK